MTTTNLFVRARSLTGFAELVRRHGGDPEALLQQVGIAAAILDDPELSFPLVHFAAVLDVAAHALGMPDFGAQLASGQDVSVLGPVALIARHASTVQEAMQGVIRYMPYHSPGAAVQLVDHGEQIALELNYDVSVQGGGKRQLTELSYLVSLAGLRMMSELEGKDWQLSFEHAPSLSPARYRRIFACKVLWNQPRSQLLIPRSVLDIPIDAANPELLAATERSVRNLIRSHPLDLGRQVETLAQRLLPTGNCTLPLLAGQLGMPGYKLQRCLARQGLHFEDIIDNLRRTRVESLLAQAHIPLTEVAFLLGYGDPSSLTRACHRWFGQSPKALRLKSIEHNRSPDEIRG